MVSPCLTKLTVSDPCRGQLLEIELEEVQVKIEERRVAATEELEKKTTKDFESEEKRLSGIFAQEEAELQKLLESAVRLRINYSKLVQQ